MQPSKPFDETEKGNDTMNEQQLRSLIQRIVLTEMARTGEQWAPVMSSNRHCHLSQTDVERLFGPGYQLTKLRDLEQPGQYACNERVTIETPKGKMALRVVGPARKETQIELSMTDAVKLGLNPPVRMSGDLQGTPGCRLTNGEKAIDVPRGVIIAARHLHIAPEEAQAYGLHDGDRISLLAEGERGMMMNNVIVRSGPGHILEAHIDKDEANACGIRDGQLCRIVKQGAIAHPAPVGKAVEAAPAPAMEQQGPKVWDVSGKAHYLISEDDVRRAWDEGYTRILHAPDALITPLARDTAANKNILLLPRLNK